MRPSLLPRWVLGLVLLFLHAPIVMLVINSVNASRFGGEWKGFTWGWYEKLWDADDLWKAVALSVRLAILASLTSVLLGGMAAWCLHRWRSRVQLVHRALLTAPLVMPDLLLGISLLLLFVAAGMQMGFFTLWITHVTFCVSYVTLVVLARLQDFDESLIEAARDLGANSWQVALRVVMPLLAPGLIAAGLLAFTLSIDDYVITFFVQGPGTTTLPLHIHSMMKVSRNMPMINALSAILLLATTLIASLGFFLSRRRTSV